MLIIKNPMKKYLISLGELGELGEKD